MLKELFLGEGGLQKPAEGGIRNGGEWKGGEESKPFGCCQRAGQQGRVLDAV